MARLSAVASSQWLETGHSPSAWGIAYLVKESVGGPYILGTSGPAAAVLALDPTDLDHPNALTLHTDTDATGAKTLIRQPTTDAILWY